MADLAGFRIVGVLDFAGQDRLYDVIASRFPPDPRPPKRIDRRASPSYGYRAIHAVVTFDGVNIEVQIRTLLQHVWANLIERLADRLGRQIRYGEPPTPPEGMSQPYADALVRIMMTTAEDWSSSKVNTMSTEVVDAEVVTEALWSGLREALRKSGIDL